MRASLLLPSLIALATSAGAQVFVSGFETWNDTLPTDWFGVKSNISSDSIEQVTVNVHAGAFAVRVRNAPSSTKRFTTQPVHVDSATVYDVTYWVRGQGDIRVALYDARFANSGYSPVTSYITVNSTTWAQQTTSITGSHTYDDAEFILYVRNTTGPDRIVVDDVSITEGVVVPPVDASIYEIQYTTAVDGNSPLNGQAVNTGGIVTGVDTIGAGGYFIQNGQGPWRGIYVFDGTSTVSIGDSLTLQGIVSEYNNNTEIGSVTDLVNVGSFTVPTPEVLTPAATSDEQWEGVLVKVFDIGATNLPVTPNWEWLAANWQGQVIVDDVMYLYTPVVGDYYTITGIMDQYQADYKLCPRQLSDIEIGSGIGELAVLEASVLPNPVSDALWVQWTGGQLHYTLADAQGRMVMDATANGPQLNIDVRKMAEGQYTLALRSDERMRTERIVVKH